MNNFQIMNDISTFILVFEQLVGIEQMYVIEFMKPEFAYDLLKY